MVFFIDIDNTLLYKRTMHPENIKAAKYARERGHLIVLNTGRSREYMPWDLMEGFEYDGIIAGIGSYVEAFGKVIYSSPMDIKMSVMLSDMFEVNGRWLKLEGEKITVLQNMSDGIHSEVMCGADVKRLCENEKMSKFTSSRLTDEEIKKLSPYFTLFSYETYSEGVLRGESKGNGIKIFLKHTGLTEKDAVALGDSLNDTEMFSACGMGAAMGNACDEIKAMSGFVSCHASEGGVAEAIYHFIGKEGK